MFIQYKEIFSVRFLTEDKRASRVVYTDIDAIILSTICIMPTYSSNKNI